MKPMFLVLEDGTVFEGRSVSEALDCVGLLSFYTGVVGYQEVITDPANLGKIILFTYPLIGNYGVNSDDAESDSPKVSGIITKEYPPYYSSFRAEGNLKDYLQPAGTVFGQRFDTRAILLHLREHGEMMAATSGEKLSRQAFTERISGICRRDYEPENSPVPCDRANITAAVLDVGVSRSFFKRLAALGVQDGANPNEADVVIVSDAPYYLVEDSSLVSQVKSWLGKKPVIGFGHGSAVVAKACGAKVEQMKFGDHGVNVPVRHLGGGRNEITVQNHNYVVVPDKNIEALFENVHDGTCEGFKCESAKAAGANFLTNEAWFGVLTNAAGVR